MSDKLPVPEEETKSKFIRAISEPLSKHGWPSWLVFLLAVIGVIYLLNPTAGIIEFLPDNLPFIGNLDESVAVMLVIAGIVELLEGKKYREKNIDAQSENTPEE